MTSAANSLPTACPGLAVEEEEEFRAFLGGEPAVLGLCGRCPYGADEGVSRVKIYVTDDADGRRS